MTGDRAYVAAPFHHTDVFPGYSSHRNDGPFWFECECGEEGPRRPTRVAASMDAHRHLPFPCASCGTVRPRGEMTPAIDRMWREIPDKYICRDQELCFQEVVKAAHAAGDARRAARASDETGTVHDVPYDGRPHEWETGR